MRVNLFSNSRNALIFAGCVLAGAVMLVDTNSGGDALSGASAGNDSRGESYQRLMARRNGSAGLRDGRAFDNLGQYSENGEGFDAAPTVEIGDYEVSAEEQGPASLREQPPGIDGPGT